MRDSPPSVGVTKEIAVAVKESSRLVEKRIGGYRWCTLFCALLTFCHVHSVFLILFYFAFPCFSVIFRLEDYKLQVLLGFE